MKTEFDLKAVAGSGRAKGDRDLEKCKNSDLPLTIAIATKFSEIHDQISSFWGHRLAHLPSLEGLKEDDKALFEQTLVLNFAAQYLSLYASLKGLEVDKVLIDMHFDNSGHLLTSMRKPDEIEWAISNTKTGPRYYADQFNNILVDLTSSYARSIYGIPNENIYWMFEKKLPKDLAHEELLTDIEKTMKKSAKENLASLPPP